MKYGWLGTSRRTDQERGFFVDEDNRILYWPKKTAPGYVLDLETAERIATSEPYIKYEGTIFLFVMFSCNFLGIFILAALDRFPLTLGDLILWQGLVCSIAFSSSIRRHKRHKIQLKEQLASEYGDRIDSPRPKPAILKPSLSYTWNMPLLIWLLAAIGIFFVFGCFGLAVTNTTLRLYDKVVVGIVCLPILWIFSRLMVRQVNGKALTDIRLFQQPSDSHIG